MSLDLTGPSGQHLSNASPATPPILTWPITLCGWGKRNSGGLGIANIWIGDSSGGFNDVTLAANGSTNWGTQWTGFDNGVGYSNVGTSSIDSSAQNVWNFYAVVIRATTYDLYAGNGGGWRANKNVAHSLGDILAGQGSYVTDGITIGRRSDGSPGPYWAGLIAEPAMYAGSLTEDELKALGGFGRGVPWQDRPRAVSPLLVRRPQLKFYAPLRNGGGPRMYDVFGYPLVHFDITTRSNPTYSDDHPNIIYPAAYEIITAPTAVVGGAAIMNQFQAGNLGADLFDGALM